MLGGEKNRRYLNSLNKVVFSHLTKIHKDDLLNYELQRSIENIPSEWTKVDLMRPIPTLLNKLSYLPINSNELKQFTIYAESNLSMLTEQ